MCTLLLDRQAARALLNNVPALEPTMADGSEDYADYMNEDEYEQGPDGTDLPPGHAQSAAGTPQSKKKKKRQGGKKGRESKARSRLIRAQKLKAWKAGVRTATDFPRSFPLQNTSELEEAARAEAAAAAAAKNTSKQRERAQEVNNTARLLAQVLSSITHMTGNAAIAEGTMPATRVDMTKVVNRPSTFDGSASGKFHEWKNEIEMYLRVMHFPTEKEAAVVQSYLKGTALAWWIQKLDQMAAAGITAPTTFAELLPYLNERFEHRNPELASRDKLMSLRQNDLSLHQYLREFEGCYAYIPRFDEADKIHRFLYGLKPFYRAKFCVDPATHQWWTNFDALVAYISAYLSDDVSGRAESIQKATNEYFNAERRDVPKDRKSYGRVNKKFTKHKLALMKKFGQVTTGRVQKRSTGSEHKTVTYQNAKGETVVRSTAVRSWCHQQKPRPGLCLGCYKPGHMVHECTNAVAHGNPEGYKAPSSHE